MIKLRPYQQDAIDKIIMAIKQGYKRIIVRAPTGAGKTIIASRIINGALSKGNRLLFMAHRSELIYQCSEKLDMLGIFHGIIMGKHNPQASARCHIASVQTLVNRNFEEPQIIIIDECHHARAATYEKIIARYPRAIVIGLTATPARTDGKGLGHIFETIIDTISYTELIEQGFLVPFTIFEPTEIDFSGVKTVGGDFNKKQAHERMKSSTVYGDVIEHWQKLASDRSTILFASNVQDSLNFKDSFNSFGVVAAHVDGKTKADERKRIFNDFRQRKIQILCNVGVATEGTDLPVASCISLASPTKSLTLHHQMDGRGLRIHPESNKKDCLILDHVGNHKRLGWIDDEIEWTLSDTKRAINKTRMGPTAQSVRRCPECYLSMRGGSQTCERCGYTFPVQKRKMKVVAAELKEASRSGRVVYRARDDGLTYYSKKVKEGIEKGYKPGYANGRFRSVFGYWPKFDMEDVRIRIMELKFEEGELVA